MPVDYDIVECMMAYGGGFVRQLAQLYRLADSDNQDRLLNAFPEIFERYRELARIGPIRQFERSTPK